MVNPEIGTHVIYIDYQGASHNALVTDTYGSTLETKSSIGLLYVEDTSTGYTTQTPTDVSWQTIDTQTSCWKSA